MAGRGDRLHGPATPHDMVRGDFERAAKEAIRKEQRKEDAREEGAEQYQIMIREPGFSEAPTPAGADKDACRSP